MQTSIRAAFDNQGEVCLCGSRIFVEEPVYRKFVEQFTEETRRLKVGDPLDPQVDQGALISRRHLERVCSYIDLARQEGGRILCGGGLPSAAQLGERCKAGAFLEPTVIVDLDVGCRVNQEEIFGPVVTITPFRTEEEVVRYANAAPFGLSASLWTRDLDGPIVSPNGWSADRLGQLLAAARPAHALRRGEAKRRRPRRRRRGAAFLHGAEDGVHQVRRG